jgi:hypothetical protein
MTVAPYVVRFGPWARNLYLGLPVAFTFALVSVVSQMPLWLFIAWNLVIGAMTCLCAFPRETQIFPADKVVVMYRLFALVPVWWRTYPFSQITGIRLGDGELAMSGEGTSYISTIYLELQSGKLLPVQSYSSGADNQPPFDELRRDLSRLLARRA